MHFYELLLRRRCFINQSEQNKLGLILNLKSSVISGPRDDDDDDDEGEEGEDNGALTSPSFFSILLSLWFQNILRPDGAPRQRGGNNAFPHQARLFLF